VLAGGACDCVGFGKLGVNACVESVRMVGAACIGWVGKVGLVPISGGLGR
jgi:hypothetical protein